MPKTDAWRAHPWLTATKVGMILIVNAAAFVPGVYPALTSTHLLIILAVATYMAIAMLLRSHWDQPLWLSSLWLLFDHGVWLLSISQTRFGMPSTLICLLLTGEAALVGWPLKRGFYHWIASTLLVSAYPYIVGMTKHGHLLLVGYVLQILPGCLFFYLFVRLIGEVSLGRQEAQRARTEAELANLHLREYAEQVEQLAVLRERNRLAREVHDTVAHGFTAIHMQLEVLELLQRTDPAEAQGLLSALKAQVRESLDETRRSVHALRPLQLEERQGIEAIRRLVAEFGRTTSIETDLIVSGSVYELDAAHEVCLYRATQEGLTNAFRHGHAKRTRVRLTFAPESITLAIEDDGVAPASSAKGLGIVGIQERAAVLGGEVTAGRAASGGFVLQITLPIGTARRGASA